jgi:DNA repair exonuclease SbcCD ATPase subunit
MKLKYSAMPACAFLLLIWFSAGFAQTTAEDNTGERVRRSVRESVEIRRQTQKEHEKWQEEKQRLTERYESLESENRRLSEKQARLSEKEQAARSRILQKEKQIADIRQVTQDVEPFLKQLASDISKLVEHDLPFLAHERQKRIKSIEKLMEDRQAPVSEKYRRVMEALFVEAEYGNTIEVYQENIEVQGRSMRANIFRLGRISLYFQSMDQEECGWFNIAEKKWEKLPTRYNRAIAGAIDIGTRRRPAELLTMPLGKMVVK